jgi:hypothetical protein
LQPGEDASVVTDQAKQRGPDNLHSRQTVAARVIARMRERGVAIDADADFVHLVGLWTSGAIDLDECRFRYLDLLKRHERQRILALTPAEQQAPSTSEPLQV